MGLWGCLERARLNREVTRPINPDMAASSSAPGGARGGLGGGGCLVSGMSPLRPPEQQCCSLRLPAGGPYVLALLMTTVPGACRGSFLAACGEALKAVSAAVHSNSPCQGSWDRPKILP